MQIAVEATCWHNRRGYGRHARALLSSLVAIAPQHDFTFVTDGDGSEIQLNGSVKASVEIVQIENSTASSDALRAGGRRSLPDVARMGRELSRSKYDTVIFPSVFSHVPTWTRANKIVFQHDAIPELLPGLTSTNWQDRVLWRAKSTLARWQANRLVTVSEYSRKALAKHYQWPMERIAVVGEAPDPVFRQLESLELTPALRATTIDWEQPKTVYVGGIGPHKNLIRLAEAFAQVIQRPGLERMQLVLVGDIEREKFVSCVDELKAACSRLGITERVVFAGYLSDEDLTVLLNRATVLVLPSLMEGFGLPAVEAAACGCPVIATKESPLPEVLGTAAFYIEPTNTQEIADSLGQVCQNPALQERMRKDGLAATSTMNWPTAAKTLLDIIEASSNHTGGVAWPSHLHQANLKQERSTPK